MELTDIIIGEIPASKEAFATADKCVMALKMQINLQHATKASMRHFPSIDCSENATILVPEFMREVAGIAFVTSGQQHDGTRAIGPAMVHAIGEAEDHGYTRYLIKIHDKFFQINPSDKNV